MRFRGRIRGGSHARGADPARWGWVISQMENGQGGRSVSGLVFGAPAPALGRAAENVGGSRRRVDAFDEGRFAGGITHVGRLGGGILHGAELVRLRVRRREGG